MRSALGAWLLLVVAPLAHAQVEEPLPEGAVGRLGSARLRLGPDSTGLALSPDGRLLVTYDATRGALLVLDAGTGARVRAHGASHLFADVFAFAGGRLFATNTATGNAIQMYEPTGAGVAQQFLPRSGERFARFAPSADGKTLATVEEIHRNVRVQVVDVGSGRGTRTFPVLHDEQIGVALSADGAVLATWGRCHAADTPEARAKCRTVQLWDVATGRGVGGVLAEEPGGVVAVAPDGKTLAVATTPTVVEVWDVVTNRSLVRLPCRAGQAARLFYSPDGKTLAAVARDGATHLWDLATKQTIAKTEAAAVGTFVGLAFPAPGRVLVCVRQQQAVHLWEATTGKLLSPVGGHVAAVVALAFRPDGKELVSVDAGGLALAWGVRERRELSRQPLGNEAGQPLPLPAAPRAVLSADAGRVLLGGLDPGYTLHDPTTGRRVQALPGGGHSRFGAAPHALSADGSLLALRGTDGLGLWDARTGRRLRSLPSQPGDLARVAFAPDGTRLVAVSSSDEVLAGGVLRVHLRLWDVAAGEELARADDATAGAAATLAFSPDGRLLALDGRDGGLTLLDAVGLQVLQDGAGEERPTTPAVFSPDGHSLATGLAGGRVALWEALTGRVRRVLGGGGHTPTVLAWSPDGRLLASGGLDGTVLLWDATGPAGGPAAPIDDVGAELAGTDARRADAAMRRLVATPTLALPWIGKNVAPAPGTESPAAALARLIARLDDDDFDARQQAAAELEALGGEALPALRQALVAPAPEVRARAAEILQRQRTAPAAKWLLPLRAVEVLERIGGDEARAILTRLATGNPHARLTQTARAALER